MSLRRRQTFVPTLLLLALLCSCSGESATPAPPATPAPMPSPEPRYESPVESMTIPAIRVESAPLVSMNVKGGYMELPYNPHEIAWYDFTSKPGKGSNAVFSA